MMVGGVRVGGTRVGDVIVGVSSIEGVREWGCQGWDVRIKGVRVGGERVGYVSVVGVRELTLWVVRGCRLRMRMGGRVSWRFV